eukprot:808304-Pelagomonas_calceolata.AAC.1
MEEEQPAPQDQPAANAAPEAPNPRTVLGAKIVSLARRPYLKARDENYAGSNSTLIVAVDRRWGLSCLECHDFSHQKD